MMQNINYQNSLLIVSFSVLHWSLLFLERMTTQGINLFCFFFRKHPVNDIKLGKRGKPIREEYVQF